jgi:hypothetical protein
MAMLRCSLIRREKLEDNDVLGYTALEDVGAAMNGPDNCWMLFEAQRCKLLMLFNLGCVTGLLWVISRRGV